MAPPYAFVTLLTSDSYLPGALTIAAALKDLHTSPPVHPEVDFHSVCLVAPEYVDVSTIKLLRRAFNVVIGVEIIAPEDDTKLKLLGRPDLDTVLTKLHVFRLTQYSKIIFLDADVLPIRPLSHLFTLPHEFSAVPDVGWPDIFNSGVMVLSPGQDKFDAVSTLLKSKGSWDGGDQGILNEWRGKDWNRLSFTYNTTPSAMYMYAPAYERYGSDVSVVHFIGPNKPWDNLPYRPPGTCSADTPSDQQRVYDYNSLIDRWYAVYDRHYRLHTLPPKPEFEVQRYTSAWDVGREVVDHLPPSTIPAGGALVLDDLRRIAVEGMSHSGAPSLGARIPPEGEGEYQRMPLDGRIDLMRPKKEEEEPQKEEEESRPSTPITQQQPSDERPSTTTTQRWHVDVPEGSPPRLGTLPTPAPHEIPSAPHIRLLSLPPSLPSTPTPIPSYKQQPTINEGPLYEEPGLHPRADERQPPQSQLEERSRPASPPLLSWNPAVEPPPKTHPPVSAFPTDTYFPNAWDHSRGEVREESHTSYSPPASTDFFRPLPPPEIPEILLRQGHYRKVTGEEAGATPSPDRSKVKHVFPWENEPRHLPGRVFPPSDGPPPGTFLSPRPATPSTPENQVSRMYPMPSPLSGLPSTLNYANAWDTVPSIQRYATWLSRTPPSPPALLAPAFDVTRRRGKGHTIRSWSDRVEGNSRDGDDEDSANDAENEGDEETARWVNDSESENDRSSGKKSVSSTSKSPIRRRKRYVSSGIQTSPRQTRDKGIQVSLRTLAPYPSSGSGRLSWPPASAAVTLRPVLAPDSIPEFDPKATTTSTMSTKDVTTGPLMKTPESAIQTSPSQPLSVLQAPAQLRMATEVVTPPRMTIPTLPSSLRTMTSPSTSSPLSSIGPLSPPEGEAMPLPARKAGRVWDPARRVELFKRGSEEVMARFLKMGSWEEDTTRA